MGRDAAVQDLMQCRGCIDAKYDEVALSGAPLTPPPFTDPTFVAARRVQIDKMEMDDKAIVLDNASSELTDFPGPSRLLRSKSMAGGNVLIPLDDNRSDTENANRAYWIQRKIGKTAFGTVRIGYVLRRCGSPSDEQNARALVSGRWTLTPRVNDNNNFRTGEEYEMVAIKQYEKRKLDQAKGKGINDPFNDFSASQLLSGHSPDESHILGVKELLTDGQFLYAIFPYCDGGNLHTYVKRNGRLDEVEARYFFRQILDALELLQKVGVCHHDICLEHILLHRNGCFLVGKKNCLRIPYMDKSTTQGNDKPDGKPRIRRLILPHGPLWQKYAAPELLSNEASFDGHTTDLWSAAIVLFSMLFGGPPFIWASKDDPRFVAISVQGKLSVIATNSFGNVESSGENLSQDAADLLQRMLRADPKGRLSLDEVKNHPWVVSESNGRPHLTHKYQNLVEQKKDSVGERLPTPSESLEKTEKVRMKQFKKEEGRRRAKEIAMERKEQARLHEQGLGEVGRSGRHGARNQDRHKQFVRWLIQTFPQLQTESAGNTKSLPIQVLDVAGGKGELAARLSMCHAINVVVVDPRPADVANCFETVVLPRLPKKWQQRIRQQSDEDANFVSKKINSRVSQLVTTLDDRTINSAAIQDAIRSSSLLIGMHADSATEAIVDAALAADKPFVVVPCCVFPRLFPQRNVEREDGSHIPVRTHQQFVEYLLQKDSRFVKDLLPFEGRNVAVLWKGEKSASNNGTRPLTCPRDGTNRLAPYNPTHTSAISMAIDMLHLQSNDVLFDLGCGDGRMLIKAAQRVEGIRCVGIDIDSTLIKCGQDSIAKLQETSPGSYLDRSSIDIRCGDVLEEIEAIGHAPTRSTGETPIQKMTFLDEATAVFVYLLPTGLEKIKPLLDEAATRRQKCGEPFRVVSYMFKIPGIIAKETSLETKAKCPLYLYHWER